MSKKVLVAEDEGLLRRLIQRVLVKNGYTVVLAQDGQQALRLLKDHQIEVALIDVNMPSVCGLEVLDTIKREYPHVKTILTSGDVDSVYSHDPAKRPCVYLSKPFRMERLVDLL